MLRSPITQVSFRVFLNVIGMDGKTKKKGREIEASCFFWNAFVLASQKKRKAGKRRVEEDGAKTDLFERSRRSSPAGDHRRGGLGIRRPRSDSAAAYEPGPDLP